LIEVKLYFCDGNFGTFAQMLETTMNNVEKNKKQKKYVNADKEFIRNLTVKSNTILRDPNDPTKIMISKDYSKICDNFYNNSCK